MPFYFMTKFVLVGLLAECQSSLTGLRMRSTNRYAAFQRDRACVAQIWQGKIQVTVPLSPHSLHYRLCVQRRGEI